MLLAQYWRSFQNCAIFDCECGAVLDDLRHDDRRGGEKLMNCQRSDVLVLRMLVRPVKMNPGPALDRSPPANSSHLASTKPGAIQSFRPHALCKRDNFVCCETYMCHYAKQKLK